MTSRRGLALAAAAALTAAGCGERRLSAEELRSRATATCARVEGDLRMIGQVGGDDPAAARTALERTTALTGKAIADLAALEPPEDLERRYDALLGNLREQQELAERIADALAAGKGQPDAALVARGRRLAGANTALARELGIPACAASA